MRKNGKALALVLSMAMLAGTMTGCGSKEETPTEAAKAAETTAATEAATEEATEKIKEDAASGLEGQTVYVTEKTPLRLGRNNTGSVMVHIADAKGFFEEENLDVEFIRIPKSADGLNAMLGGQIDIAVDWGCAYPLKFINEGADFTIFGGNLSAGHALIGKSDQFEDYDGIEDLKGKRVIVSRGNTGSILQVAAMARAGLVEGEDWERVETSESAYTMVSSGKADAAQGGWKEVYRAQKGGDNSIKILDWTSQMFGNEGQICCRMTTNTSWLEENQDVAKAFLRACIRAEEVRFTDPDYAVEVLVDRLEYDPEEAHYYIYEVPQYVYADPESDNIIDMLECCNLAGFFEPGEDVDFKSHINIELYKEVLDTMVEENPDNQYYKDLQARYDDQNQILIEERK